MPFFDDLGGGVTFRIVGEKQQNIEFHLGQPVFFADRINEPRIEIPAVRHKINKFHFYHLWFKRFSAEKRKSLDIGRPQRFYDLIFRFFRVWLSILEIPCLRIETALAMMTSVRYKQADTHPRTIGDIIFLIVP